MKNKFTIAILSAGVIAIASLTGCVGAGQWQQALANDQADVNVTLSTPWGTETIQRRGHPPVPASPVVGTNAPLPALSTLPGQ